VQIVLGAYPLVTPGANINETVGFYQELAVFPEVVGIEIPARQLPDFAERPELLAGLPAHWFLDVTTLPTTMAAGRSDASYGLASRDDHGRQVAVQDVASLLPAMSALGERTVRSVSVVSAPRLASATSGRSDELAKSLSELAALPWGATSLTLEHCDAGSADHSAAKGFLSLATELDAIERAGTNTMIKLNWARSAIEGRSAAHVLEHIRHASEGGRLKSLVFSGVSDQETAWGPAWADAHIPPASDQAPIGIDEYASSVLTDDRIREALAAIGPHTEVGVKVAVRPRDAANAAKIAVVRTAIDQVVRASGLNAS
jgi:hypothetical protein